MEKGILKGGDPHATCSEVQSPPCTGNLSFDEIMVPQSRLRFDESGMKNSSF